jgi:hypothetical protein
MFHEPGVLCKVANKFLLHSLHEFTYFATCAYECDVSSMKCSLLAAHQKCLLEETLQKYD